MCSIIGSFDKKKIEELVKLNLYRGNSTFSISEFDLTNNNITKSIRVVDKLTNDIINSYEFNKNTYYILHLQAPTNNIGLTEENIHPAYYKKYGYYLWHNGIILQKDIEKLSKKYCNNINYTWDTKLLLDLISENNFKILNKIEGSFSCLFYKNKKMFLFRTTSAPLFIDNKLNISSTEFKGSSSIDPGRVFLIDFENKRLVEKDKFNCKDNPYFIQ